MPGNAAPAPDTDEIPQAVSFDLLRRRINAEVTGHAVAMVRATIDHAKEGQYQALKYLLEMIGLFPATPQEETQQEDSLAQLLLKRLGISAEPEVATVAGEKPMAARQDAVE